MNRLSALLLIILLLPLHAQPQSSNTLVITHVTIIDATGAPPQTDMTVVISGDRMTTIGKTGKVKIPAKAEVIDATGKFLIPGLWDLHVHLTNAPDQAVSRELMLPLLVANGVVGVREMGGDWTRTQQLRQEISEGAIIGPHIVAAGSFVDGPPPFDQSVVVAANETEARDAVRKLKAAGVDFIKVQAQLSPNAWRAILDEAKQQNISVAGHIPEQISAFEIAKSSQRSIEHTSPILPGDAGLLLACSSKETELRAEMLALKEAESQPNADRVKLRDRRRALQRQMLETYDEKKAAALFALLVKHKVYVVPTLIWAKRQAVLDANDQVNEAAKPFLPATTRNRLEQRRAATIKAWTETEFAFFRSLQNKSRDLVKAMFRANVSILAGTDAMDGDVLPGISLHQELEELVTAGLTPLEALQAATRNAARFLGQEKIRGTIDRGKRADLVLLDADPLQAIQNTQKIHAVVIGGKLISAQQREQMLARVRAFASAR